MLVKSKKLIGISASIFAAFFSVQSARAVTYTADVLYPFTPPAGFTGGAGDYGAGGQYIGVGVNGSTDHATLWNTSGTPTDLNPAGYADSYAGTLGGGLFGTQQVGWATVTSGGNDQAFLWSGGAAVALLWSGTATSAANLNPSGYTGSIGSGINAMDATQQVGYATNAQGFMHAILWNGSASNYVDLTPGTVGAQALGIGGSQQVGIDDEKAALWNGTVASLTFLNPTGYTQSGAYATNGTTQVGEATLTSTNISDAMLWNSSSTNYLDLSTLIPASYGTLQRSYAYSIDSSGNVYGFFQSASGTNYAVEWVASVPEPSCFALLIAASALTLKRRRKTSRPA
jgi:hypothetical protein